MRRLALLATFAMAALVLAPGSPARAARLSGTPVNEAIFGTVGKDRINSGGGNDLLFGGLGNDQIKTSGAGTSIVLPGPGKDKVTGGTATDFIVDDDGTPKDRLKSGKGNDQIFSADGAKDLVDCGKGSDTALADPQDKVVGCENIIRGSVGEYIRMGTNEPEALGPPPLNNQALILGKGGNDTLTGGDVSDAIWPGSGADSVSTSTGTDSIFDDDGVADTGLNGGPGVDTILSADGAAELIDCGSEADTVYFFTGDIGINANCETQVSGLGEVVAL